MYRREKSRLPLETRKPPLTLAGLLFGAALAGFLFYFFVLQTSEHSKTRTVPGKTSAPVDSGAKASGSSLQPPRPPIKPTSPKPSIPAAGFGSLQHQQLGRQRVRGEGFKQPSKKKEAEGLGSSGEEPGGGGQSPVQPQTSDMCSGTGEALLRCWFELGLRAQERAEREQDPARGEFLEKARGFYELALRQDSNCGEVLNNLAGVYADLKRDEDAERLFQRAVAPNDDKLRPFYRRNYGDFLLNLNLWERAAQQYRLALEEEPESFQTHQALVKVLSEHKPGALPEYLWFLIDKQQAVWVGDVALDRLRKDLPEEELEQYLTLLVCSLGQQSYAPEQVARGDIGKVLNTLSRRPLIGSGARSVLDLHSAVSFDPSRYSWWAERKSPTDVNAKGLTPRTAFRALIRALGESARTEGQLERAEDYFLLAATFVPDEADLEASRLLAATVVSTEHTEVLDKIVSRNELLLERTTPDEAMLYLYRHDLGLLYSHRQRWGNEGTPASAIYQLARAKELALQVSKLKVDERFGIVKFDARLYSRLADGYLATQNADKARRTLMDLVKAYQDEGLKAEAEALAAVIAHGPAPRSARPRPSGWQPAIYDDPPLLPPHPEIEPPKPPPSQ